MGGRDIQILNFIGTYDLELNILKYLSVQIFFFWFLDIVYSKPITKILSGIIEDCAKRIKVRSKTQYEL